MKPPITNDPKIEELLKQERSNIQKNGEKNHAALMSSIRRQANQQYYTKITARNYDERQVNIVKNIHTMKENKE